MKYLLFILIVAAIMACTQTETNVPDNLKGNCKKGHMEKTTIKDYWGGYPAEIHYWVCDEIDTTIKK